MWCGVGWLIGKMKRTREKKSKLRWSSMCWVNIMSLNFNALAHTESAAMAIPCMCACNVYACRAGDDKATLDNGKLVDRPDCHIQLYIMTQAKKKSRKKNETKNVVKYSWPTRILWLLRFSVIRIVIFLEDKLNWKLKPNRKNNALRWQCNQRVGVRGQKTVQKRRMKRIAMHSVCIHFWLSIVFWICCRPSYQPLSTIGSRAS